MLFPKATVKWLPIALLVATGCRQVFGIDTPALADGATTMIVGRLVEHDASNDVSYHPILTDRTYIGPSWCNSSRVTSATVPDRGFVLTVEATSNVSSAVRAG